MSPRGMCARSIRASRSAELAVIVPCISGIGSAPLMNSSTIWPSFADTRRENAPKNGPDFGRVASFLVLRIDLLVVFRGSRED
jgi:hypothetical protein